MTVRVTRTRCSSDDSGPEAAGVDVLVAELALRVVLGDEGAVVKESGLNVAVLRTLAAG